jgi:hypothetical protein
MEKAQPRHWGAIAVLLAMAAGPSQAAAPDPNDWQFAIAPYLWFPNVSGALRFSGSSSTGGGILDVGARWGDIQLSYRYLTYELGGSALIQRLTLKGPVLSALFRF